MEFKKDVDGYQYSIRTVLVIPNYLINGTGKGHQPRMVASSIPTAFMLNYLIILNYTLSFLIINVHCAVHVSYLPHIRLI